MRLLFLCPHFEPDLHAATGEVMTQLVYALAQRGHTIDVVTALPWYHKHDVEPQWRGKLIRHDKASFGSVTRVWPFPTNKSNIPARAVGFAGFNALVVAGAVARRRPDAVLAMSPPIVIGDAGWLAAKRFRVPFVFNVQDIFPDVAVELGALNDERIIRIARRYERSIYNRSDAVTVLSDDQARNVRSKCKPSTRVEIIHNFVDLNKVRHIAPSVAANDAEVKAFRSSRTIGDEFVVGYSGNVGLSQSFHLVKAAAEAFADEPDVRFLINGEGSARNEVQAWADTMDNVSVGDFVPRDQVSAALGAIDLHLILLREGLSRSSTPSKLYGILASGRPVLASIDEGSEVANVIEQADCGRAVPPDEPASFVAALREMLADRRHLQQQGANGRSFVEKWMTPQAQAEAYENLFEQLAAKRTTQSPGPSTNEPGEAN